MNVDEALKLALKYHQSGDFFRAEQLYGEILKVQSSNADVYSNLGNVLQDIGRIEDAITSYKMAIEVNPNFAGAYYNLGDIFLEKSRFDDAIACYTKAIELKPGFVEAYNNLGIALKSLAEFEKAISCFRIAIKLNSRFYRAYNNLANTLDITGNFKEALFYYQKTVEINPDISDAHFNLGQSLLLHGNFTEGWKEYEWRWKTDDFHYKHRRLSQPAWSGSSLKGMTIFVYEEQGIGDQIMFSSILPDIMNQASLCIVECEKRLVPLFARSFPSALITGSIDEHGVYPSAIPDANFQVAIGTLPLFLRPNLTSFPCRRAYFQADHEQVNQWQFRMKALGNGINVGISWKGGSDPDVRRTRSTFLEQWGPLFSMPGIHFINLQYGDSVQELQEIKDKYGITIHDWEDADPLKNLDWFAAQISALDLVISIDNATVHMAGALGVPVWTLLPYACNWRWMMNREDSPWYPTIRLFRQEAAGDWKPVMESVAKALKGMAVPYEH
jgi:tetratricopeptide (TPR) repeat protein